MSSIQALQRRRTHESVQPINAEALQERDGSDHYWSWFDDYLKAIIGIAVLGGQITFTLIVSDIADPMKLNPSSPDNGTRTVFYRETVRLFIAISWLFFTFTLGFGVLTHLLFTGDRRGSLAPRLGGVFYWVMTFLLNFLPIGAFLLLSLAIAAYVPVVGWIGVAFTSLLALSVLFFWQFGW